MTLWQRLMTPRSVAIVGASENPTKTSGQPLVYLRQHGYPGKIFPVNPRVNAIAGLPCYPSIAALPQPPDVALILLDAERCQQAVRELAERGTAAAIVLASGYAETGEAGMRRQEALRQAAGTMRLLGPNTIGLVNPTDGIVLSASSALAAGPLCPGAIGLVSQSGGILGALLSRANARGLGFSRLIATGNEADLALADFLSLLVDDAATRVIALYLEGIRHPAAFLQAARKAQAAGKPVVAFKVGRSESGARAAASHTGALAGADRMVDALFQQAGIVRAQTFADVLDMSAALACGTPLRGNRVALLTSTGGAGALLADSLGLSGFVLPLPDPPTMRVLSALQIGEHAVLTRNPVDVTLAGLNPELLRAIVHALLDSPSYDALVVVVGSSGVAQPNLMATVLGGVTTHKPIIAYVSPHAPAAVAALSRRGIVALHEPERVAAALKALCQYDKSTPPTVVDCGVREPSTSLQGLPHGALDEAQAKALFARFGIPIVRECIVRDAQDAQRAAQVLGPQVVLKILSSDITHKSEIGGVATGVTAASIATRLAQMRTDVRARSGAAPTAYLVQETVDGVAELILGVHKDALGTALLIGMGGVMAELMRDTTLLWLADDDAGALAPERIRSALRALQTWPLLDGYRGRPKADLAAIVDAVRAFGVMAQTLGERLLQAEINPLFVRPQGQGVVAADGVAVLT